MSDPVYGLLGRTLGHSYSPAIHAALGDTAYRLIELEPEELPAFLARPDIGGLNVTIPYKKDVLPFCDSVSDSVRRIGAANTLVRRNGKLQAYNTDKPGFITMTHSAGISLKGAKVLVLGTGGASRAVIAGLEDMGAADIISISRTGENNYQNLDRHADADVIVNTTPVGMYPNVLQSPLSLDGFPRLRGVLDVIYNPARTGLLLQAEERGIPCAGGLTMLVAQAVKSHCIFFNSEVPDGTVASIVHDLRVQEENIILIGMPGSGKTTIAAELGARTGKPVVDLDAEIEKAAGMSIPSLFAEKGEPAFRDLESEQIARFGAKSGQILSMGGGAVLREENYLPLHQNGRIYWLQRSLDALPMDGRPLSRDRAALEKMYQERESLYARFSDAVIVNDSTPQHVAQAILDDYALAQL